MIGGKSWDARKDLVHRFSIQRLLLISEQLKLNQLYLE